MPGRTLYHLVTALFAASVAFSGFASLALAPPIRATFEHLSLPLALAVALGVAKLVGALALYVPGRPRLREWAYAGLTFELSGAALLHLAAGDRLELVAPPAMLGLLGLLSYALYRGVIAPLELSAAREARA